MIVVDFARRPSPRPAIGRTPIATTAFVTALLLALPAMVLAGW
ncbi:hypothetical protein [Stella sp.]